MRAARGERPSASIEFGSRSSDGEGFVIGACFLVRRSAFTEAGGFDTRYWLYGEEADLCWRIRDAGWTIATVDDADGSPCRWCELRADRPPYLRTLLQGG